MSGQVPRDDNNTPVVAGYDASGHQVVAAEIVSVSTDSTTGVKHGALNVNASFSASSLSINDPNTTSQKAGVNAAGSLQVAGQGTAGTPAGGVVSIQGVASGTAVKVDNSAVTQPTNITQMGGSAVSLGSKTSANSMPVVIASDQGAIAFQHGNVVDSGNSSTSTLTANSIFTGTGASSLNYSALSIDAFADQASAANGLQIQQSQDNVNWDISDNFTISASTAFNTVVNLVAQFYRVKYTNGGTNQGTFRLQTVKMVADVVLPRTLTSAGALRTDGSATTQPVNIAQIGGITTQMATSDGVNPANMPEQMMGVSVSGGQVDSSGKPTQLGLDRMLALQGKARASGTITSTVAGDTALAFSSAPKTIMPGQRVRLSGSGTNEYAVVSASYVPSSSATSIPIQVALVQAGNTTATWDVYAANGPGNNPMLPTGIVPIALAVQDTGTAGDFYAAAGGWNDSVTPGFMLEALQGIYNGVSVDRARGNVNLSALINASSVSTTQTSSDQTNYNGRGVKVWWNITTFGAALTLSIQYKDSVSSQYITALSSAAISANGFTQYTIYPGITATANVSLSDVLPRTWRVQVTGASSSTFTVGACVMV